MVLLLLIPQTMVGFLSFFTNCSLSNSTVFVLFIVLCYFCLKMLGKSERHLGFLSVMKALSGCLTINWYEFIDSWQQVGLLLVTSFNCGWILSFSNLMLVPLGWTWGIICLFVVGLYSAYANWLLAAFHFIDGRRFIRYRDLMGFLFGEFYHIPTEI
jgi:hypothetical protein